jgi:hypothetical protein
VNFNVQTPLQIVFLNNLKTVGPLDKMKPCTRRGPKIGKKTVESCDFQTLDNQVNAVVGALMKEQRNKWQTTAGQANLDRQYGNSFSASTI